MRMRYGVCALVLVSLLVAGGLGQALAQGEDPNLIPLSGETTSIGAVVPVLAGGGNNTIFFLYSTDSSLTSSSPARIRIQLFSTAGASAGETTVTLSAPNSTVVVSSTSDLNAQADGVAVITRVTSTATDTSGNFGGSALYVDLTLGAAYERHLIVGRGTGNTWPAFSTAHLATYVQIGIFSTRLHILCPGDSSSTSNAKSALTNRIQALGTLRSSGSDRTRHFDLNIFSASGTLLGTATGLSCDGQNFQNVSAPSLSGFFSTLQGGLFQIIGSTASASSHASGEALGDLIVWRIIGVNVPGFGAHALDTRAQIRR